MEQGYDLIGDIHGCGETLIKLLEQMGYTKKNGVYQHPKRKVVFLGDIVDRGPHIRLACHVVRDMVDAGHADIVMGNHEYNLVTYLTDAPPGIRQPYLRPHTPRNTFIVEQTLEQFAGSGWCHTAPDTPESCPDPSRHAPHGSSRIHGTAEWSGTSRGIH